VFAAAHRISGDADQPEQARTVVLIRSASDSLSCRIDSGGATNDFRIDTGNPALLPGV
jgi:hypothetical protein